MTNERVTEEIVRQHLQAHGVPHQILEEQASESPRIVSALRKASKSGDGIGKPEFIVQFPDDPMLVLVVECKASTRKHSSTNRDNPRDYAVDGVLHYAAELSRDFNVIALAVSGTTPSSLKVSTFQHRHRSDIATDLTSRNGAVRSLIPVSEMIRAFKFDPEVRNASYADLMVFSRVLHNYMRDKAKLSEAEKPLVVSGILLALRDKPFNATWREYTANDLGVQLLEAITRQAKAAVPNETKRKVMMQPYGFLDTHPQLNKVKTGSWPLRQLVDDIEQRVRPFIQTYEDVDVLGQFYGEFLRYAGGDKKGLGIVLTPRHLTELFAELADLRLTDTVVDTCSGTGGFLIAAMTKLDELATSDAARLDIRQRRLVGVEQQPHMFALAVSNMILRGDGKANLFNDSCFDVEATLKKGEAEKFATPTVGLINPPFSQKGDGLHELDFVRSLLDSLAPAGRAVVVLPMSCALEEHPLKAEILSRHRLVAAMSLPDDLFAPVGVVPIVLTFEAHRPHDEVNQKTWFSLWKDDGFVKVKNQGRIDADLRWEKIRKGWVAAYRAKKTQKGFSLSRRVGPSDEWCAEAYIPTDYSKIGLADIEATLKNYAVFSLLHRNAPQDQDDV